MEYPLIGAGERATIAGRTGSGKSTLGRWLLSRSDSVRWIILNPKHTKAYSKLPDSNTLSGINFAKLEKSMAKHRFTIINPTRAQSSPENMDDFVGYMHDNYENIGLCVDELYSLHKNGQPGDGLVGWLTRGRELNQSFLGLTQRPAWVSKFLFSECDYVGSMTLALREDRKRMYEITGRDEMELKMPPHYWYWYDMSKDTLKGWGPVPMR